MSALDERTAAIAPSVPELATGIFAGLGLLLTAGAVADGRDPARPLAPEASIGITANLLGMDGRVAGRLVIAATAEAAAVLIEDGGPSEALVTAIAGRLRSLPAPMDGLLADRYTIADGATALAGIARDSDPAPLAVPLDSAGRHVATVALAVTSTGTDPAPGGPGSDLPPLPDPRPASAPNRSLSTLGDVHLAVTVELGRAQLPLRELLGLQPGSVVELDRTLRQPVDIAANGTLIARGEVVVVDDAYGVRVTELVEGD